MIEKKTTRIQNDFDITPHELGIKVNKLPNQIRHLKYQQPPTKMAVERIFNTSYCSIKLKFDQNGKNIETTERRHAKSMESHQKKNHNFCVLIVSISE